MSSYAEGQIHQLANALEGEDFTSDDITKLGQYKELNAVRGVLRGTHEIKPVERVLVRSWREKRHVIYFPVTSDGTTGAEFVNRLRSKGFGLSFYAESILCSAKFTPTAGVTTKIAVLKGSFFGGDDDGQIMQKICAEAKHRNLSEPRLEVACLIHEKYTNEEIEAMGIKNIITLHHQTKDPDGDPYQLFMTRGDGGRSLLAHRGEQLGGVREDGFAFAVSQARPTE